MSQTQVTTSGDNASPLETSDTGAGETHPDNGVKREAIIDQLVTTDFDPPTNMKCQDADGDVKMEDNFGLPSASPEGEGTKYEEESAEPELESGSSKRPSTTPPVSSKTKAVKSERKGPQLISHLPRAEEAALKTFVEIQENHYQYGTLGRSREALESMMCDCQFEPGVDSPEDACGDDCINRLTQVECMPDDCRCRSYCQNQRFQRKAYAPIEIVQTEMKGFGLRAAEDLRKDTFIYEYVGDVVSNPSFVKRMRQYAEEGIRHFYFMMLQKDEFIDATKRGGIGRFANHSCNPNCYVAKWTVGEYVRMGIFAHRNIKKGEELTFNYNVDRYGHDAQPCYCGEDKCVGFIGGKTQTDIAAMDDLYLDALGISDEVEQLGLKGSKKKKGKKLDEDFIPTLKPLTEKDVPKLVQAMRQTQSRKVLFKLLTRIKLTEDQSALRQLMRLRGFSVMNNILEDYSRDLEIATVAIECMMTWPLIQRNKVEDSKIDVPVKACAESEIEVLSALAKKLLEQWEGLEYAYRIPKRLKVPEPQEEEDEIVPGALTFVGRRPPLPPPESRPYKRSRVDDMFVTAELNLKPLGFSSRRTPPRHSESFTQAVEILKRGSSSRSVSAPTKEQIAAVIAAAAAAAEAPPPVEDKPEDEPKPGEASGSTRKKSSKHKTLSAEEKEANKEKRLLKLVGAVVVKCMSKYQKQMDHELFKKHAKELTHIIAEKEKKSSSYKEGRLDALSDEKVTKIKKFAKEYIAKVMRKLEKAGQRKKPSSSSRPHRDSDHGGPPASTSTPEVQEDADELLEPPMSVNEAMGFDDNDNDNDDGADEDGSPDGQPSPDELATPQESFSGGPGTAKPVVSPIADPRLRHRNEEWRWEPDQDSVSVLQGPGAVSVGS